MIKQFSHKGLADFFETGSKAGIQPDHAKKLSQRLNALENARTPEDMKFPGWDLHSLKGDLDGHWSVKVNGNWRITFTFDGSDAILVNYQDYH